MLAKNARNPMSRFEIRHSFSGLDTVQSGHPTMEDANEALSDMSYPGKWGRLYIVDNSKDVAAEQSTEEARRKLDEEIAFEDKRQELLAKRRKNQIDASDLATASMKTPASASLPPAPTDLKTE